MKCSVSPLVNGPVSTRGHKDQKPHTMHVRTLLGQVCHQALPADGGVMALLPFRAGLKVLKAHPRRETDLTFVIQQG